MKIASSKNKFESLSTLRGIAIIGVITTHLWPSLKKQNDLSCLFLDLITEQFIDVGKIGVALMFLISGFLVPYKLGSKTKFQFIKERFFRLYPAYWISIVFAILAYNGTPTLKQILANLTMFQSFLGEQDLCGVYWTMPIQILIYISWVVRGKSLQKNTYNDFFFLLYMISGIFCAWIRYLFEIKLPTALFILLGISELGYYLRLHIEHKLYKKTFLNKMILFLAGLLPITLLSYSKNYGYFETWYRYFSSYLLAIGSFYLIVNFNLKNKFLSLLGNSSYYVYLTHASIYTLIIKTIHLPLLPLLILSLVCIFAIGHILYYIFDQGLYTSIKLGTRSL